MHKKLTILLSVALIFPLGTAFVARPLQAKSSAVATSALRPISPAGLKKAIAARKGRPVLVNFWATWCPQCREEFPALVRLQRDYARRGLAVIFVTIDEPEDKAKAARFLREQKAGGAHYIAAGDVFEFLPKFDARVKTVALPRTYIYNKQGREAKVIGGKALTYKQFVAAVKPHL